MDGNNFGGDRIVRYRTTHLMGKLMVHCHNSLHADMGMLAKEYVRNVSIGGGTCECDVLGPIDGKGILPGDLQSIQVTNGVAVVSSSAATASQLMFSLFSSLLVLVFF